MIEYRQERFQDYFAQLFPMFVKHWHEVGMTGVDETFNPDIDRYIALESVGLYVGTGAFDGDEVIGYVSTPIDSLMHNKHVTVGITEAIFLKEEYRKSRIGYNLIKFTKQVLKDLGVNYWSVGLDASVVHRAKLFERLGFEETQRNYIVRL